MVVRSDFLSNHMLRAHLESSGIDKDVSGFYITVRDTEGVQMFDCSDQLIENVLGIFRRHGAVDVDVALQTTATVWPVIREPIFCAI